MLVTVAINTWNRARLLDATLAQLGRAAVPAGVRVRVVVVDNNSTDDTKGVVAAHAGRLPVEYVFEPRQGTSFAKNAAVDRAAGDLTLWTDDDVLVDEGWVRAYLAAAAAFPDAAIFGGPIAPWTPGGRLPRWAADNLDLIGAVWALQDYGPEVRPLGAAEEVFGANMGFRTAALKGYRFDPRRGDVGGKVRKGEEVDLIARMRAAGHRAVWVGTARVRHYIPPGRLTRGYVWEFLAAGHEGLYDPAGDAGAARVGRVPRHLLRTHLTARARALVLSPWKTRRWAEAYVRAAGTLGLLRAARRLPAGPPGG